jgi:hypothetical protein
VLEAVIVALIACAAFGATLLSRLDRAGTGFLLGGLLGPLGLLVIWLRRPHWIRQAAIEAVGAEHNRKDQAWREWRGY